MEALNRKPNLATVGEPLVLEDGTKIERIGITARKMMQLVNDKKMSEADRGVHLTAAKILVDGKPVVFDDLLDGFTSDELEKIVAFANGIEDEEADEKNG